MYSNAAVAPNSRHVASHTSPQPLLARRAARRRPASARCRSVRTVSGMMLWIRPPWMVVKDTTTGCSGSMNRLAIVCAATTTCEATTIGSTVRCGCEAWPPLPGDRHVEWCPTAPSSRPRARPTTPRRQGLPEVQAEHGSPRRRARPRRSSPARRPGGFSSDGWNRNTTRPASVSRRAASTRAAPIRIAMWPSWPHACMSRGSATGIRARSPRRPAARPCPREAPRSGPGARR